MSNFDTVRQDPKESAIVTGLLWYFTLTGQLTSAIDSDLFTYFMTSTKPLINWTVLIVITRSSVYKYLIKPFLLMAKAAGPMNWKWPTVCHVRIFSLWLVHLPESQVIIIFFNL